PGHKEFLNYNAANLPGLDIKTPAKTAIINKRAVAALNRTKKAELLAKKETPITTLQIDTAAPEKSSVPVLVQNLLSDINQSLAMENSGAIAVKPDLNAAAPALASGEKGDRTVINYEDDGIGTNTANTVPTVNMANVVNTVNTGNVAVASP